MLQYLLENLVGEASSTTPKKKAPPGRSLMHPEYGYVYKEIEGVVYPPFANAEVLRELRSKDWSEEEDILIATYPKCGTTWMQQIVLLLLTDATGDVDPMDLAPWIDRECSLLGSAELEKIEKRIAGRRVWKTHAPAQLLPAKKWNGKIIVVSRNPKDAAVSMYKHYLGLPNFKYDGPWSHFFDELFMHGNVGHGDYFDHVKSWHNFRSDKMLWLTFESLTADVRGGVRKVAEFLEIPFTDDLLDRVVAYASFDSMKAAHEKRMESGTQRMGSAAHFRSGTAGAWKHTFTVAQSEALDHRFLAKMAGTTIRTDFGSGISFLGPDLLTSSSSPPPPPVVKHHGADASSRVSSDDDESSSPPGSRH